jgi:hypothetical protein
MATVRRAQWLLAGTLLCAMACQDRQPGLTPDEQITVLKYLDCVDCLFALDSLRALATRQADATVDSLNSALLNGPTDRALTAADSVLKIGYVRDSSWRLARGLKPLIPRDSALRVERSGYIDGYRARGAMGMGWIRTARARAYLDSALTLPFSAPVLRAVRYARDSLPPQPPR